MEEHPERPNPLDKKRLIDFQSFWEVSHPSKTVVSPNPLGDSQWRPNPLGEKGLIDFQTFWVIQRKWKPSIFEREGESRYYVLISNICLKGDKALSYALKPPKELLRMVKYDEEMKVGIEVSSKIMYRNIICNCSYYASSKQNKIRSRASLQFYIEKIVEEIKQTMKRDEIITIEHIAFEIYT